MLTRSRYAATLFVAHDDHHPFGLVTGDEEPHLFVRILLAAVDHGVGQRLAERGFDLELPALRAAHLPDDPHDLLDDGADRLDLSGDGQIEAQDQLLAVELALRGIFLGHRDPPVPLRGDRRQLYNGTEARRRRLCRVH